MSDKRLEWVIEEHRARTLKKHRPSTYQVWSASIILPPLDERTTVTIRIA